MPGAVCLCVLEKIRSVVSSSVRTSAGFAPDETLNIVKRNKDLKSGDFIVFVPSNRKGDTENDDIYREKEGAGKVTYTELKEGISWEISVSVDNICQAEKGKFLVKLSRPSVFQAVLNQTLSDFMSVCKQCAAVRKRTALINCPALSDLTADCKQLSLDQLRLLMVTEHVGRLLQSNGFFVSNVFQSTSEFLERIMNKLLGVDANYDSSIGTEYALASTCTQPCNVCSDILGKCRSSPYAINVSCDVVNEDGDTAINSVSDSGRVKTTEIILDLKRFITDRLSSSSNQPTAFEKNMNRIQLSCTSSLVSQLHHLDYKRITIEQTVQEKPSLETPQSQDLCVHVITHEFEFSQQQLIAVWQILEPKIALMKQINIVCGSVSSRRGTKPLTLAQDLFSLRHQQMKDAFTMKYGADVQGDGWKDNILCLTKAAIKFELLSTVSNQQVKLDLSTDNSAGVGPVDNKGGVFVMYNFARLSTLFLHYGEAVANETYPALPDIQAIDFSTLKLEEEWGLLFNYVLIYPNLIREIAIGLNQYPGFICTHKICQFLLSLSNSLSSYYSKTHILCEPRPHRMPVMFARLYLMKSVKRVMEDSLNLLGIEPCAQL